MYMKWQISHFSEFHVDSNSTTEFCLTENNGKSVSEESIFSQFNFNTMFIVVWLD